MTFYFYAQREFLLYLLSQSMTASAAWRPDTIAHWIDAAL